MEPIIWLVCVALYALFLLFLLEFGRRLRKQRDSRLADLRAGFTAVLTAPFLAPVPEHDPRFIGPRRDDRDVLSQDHYRIMLGQLGEAETRRNFKTVPDFWNFNRAECEALGISYHFHFTVKPITYTRAD